MGPWNESAHTGGLRDIPLGTQERSRGGREHIPPLPHAPTSFTKDPQCHFLWEWASLAGFLPHALRQRPTWPAILPLQTLCPLSGLSCCPSGEHHVVWVGVHPGLCCRLFPVSGGLSSPAVRHVLRRAMSWLFSMIILNVSPVYLFMHSTSIHCAGHRNQESEQK